MGLSFSLSLREKRFRMLLPSDRGLIGGLADSGERGERGERGDAGDLDLSGDLALAALSTAVGVDAAGLRAASGDAVPDGTGAGDGFALGAGVGVGVVSSAAYLVPHLTQNDADGFLATAPHDWHWGNGCSLVPHLTQNT